MLWTGIIFLILLKKINVHVSGRIIDSLDYLLQIGMPYFHRYLVSWSGCCFILEGTMMF